MQLSRAAIPYTPTGRTTEPPGPGDWAGTRHAFRGIWPTIHRSVYLAEGSRVIGDVEIGTDSSVWFNAVVRGDVYFVRIGARSNVQDNAVLHVTHDTNPCLVGDDVTIGHSAVVHGCTLHNGCLVGIHATVLDRATVGEAALVGAGALVKEGFEVPPGTLAAGVPAKIIRDLSEAEQAAVRAGAANYVDYVARYRAGR